MIRPHSIVWKICFLFALVQVAMSVIFVFIVHRIRNEASRGRPPAILVDRAELAACLLRAALPSPFDAASVRAAMPRRFAEDRFGPSLTVFDGAGQVLANSAATGPDPAVAAGWLAQLPPPGSTGALEVPGNLPVALVRIRDQPGLFLAAISVRSRRSSEPWPPHLAVPALLIVGTGAAGMLGVVLITRRVRKAEAGIDRLATGDLSVRLDPGPEDEFGKILRAINSMAGELSRQDQARNNLMADISHELRTPLTSLMCQLELLEARLADGPEGDLRSLGIAREDSTSLATRIADLLTLARGQIHPPDLALAPTNLQRLLARIAERFEPLCRRQGVKLETRFLPEIVELELDSGRITQSIENLLDNALKALEDGGTIALSVRLEPEWVHIDVEDDGSGIGESQVDLIFARFQRGRGSQGPGTGLGLAIARRFVELHGGSCSVRSRVGDGACFTVSLPFQGIAPQG